jgi:hypothetical protein
LHKSDEKEGIGSMCDRVKNNNLGLGIQADRSADTRLDMADWCLSAPCPPVDASCARMSCRSASCRRTCFRDDTSSYIFGGKCLGLWQGKCCEAHEDPAGNRNDSVCLFVCLFVCLLPLPRHEPKMASMCLTSNTDFQGNGRGPPLS